MASVKASDASFKLTSSQNNEKGKIIQQVPTQESFNEVIGLLNTSDHESGHESGHESNHESDHESELDADADEYQITKSGLIALAILSLLAIVSVFASIYASVAPNKEH